jgi:NTP pyrophosphatase (non-canonical NTP hydrolase)
MAIAGEAGELVAELQWKTDGEIAASLKDMEFKAQLGSEIADVLIYLVRLADVCQIDLVAAAYAKVDLNEARYPVETARGTAAKYDKLGADPP